MSESIKTLLEISEQELEEDEKYFEGDYSISHTGDFSIAGVIKKILSQIMKGTKFYRVQIPLEFILPQSALEFYSLQFTPTNNLLRLKKTNDKYLRMLHVCEWFLSNEVMYYFDGLMHLKPYNPVIGEQFSCMWNCCKMCSEFGINGTSYLVAEQVSHHPPISSYKFFNQKKRIEICATMKPESKIYLNGGSLTSVGNFEILLKKANGEVQEEYDLQFPENLVSGLFYGKKNIQPYGKFSIDCKETNLHLELNFKTNKTVEGYLTENKKKVFKISGNALDKVFYEDLRTKEKKLLIDLVEHMNFKLTQCVKELKDQSENSSRRKWIKVTKSIYDGNLKEAEKFKSMIEENERQKRKEMEKQKIQFKPKLFKKNENGKMICILSDKEIIKMCESNENIVSKNKIGKKKKKKDNN